MLEARVKAEHDCTLPCLSHPRRRVIDATEVLSIFHKASMAHTPPHLPVREFTNGQS